MTEAAERPLHSVGQPACKGEEGRPACGGEEERPAPSSHPRTRWSLCALPGASDSEATRQPGPIARGPCPVRIAATRRGHGLRQSGKRMSRHPALLRWPGAEPQSGCPSAAPSTCLHAGHDGYGWIAGVPFDRRSVPALRSPAGEGSADTQDTGRASGAHGNAGKPGGGRFRDGECGWPRRNRHRR
jgi:hypothetical protein